MVQNSNSPNPAYAKRPIWQWVLIYLVIALIVYGAIYLIFIAPNSISIPGY
jgi:hypothetical protein